MSSESITQVNSFDLRNHEREVAVLHRNLPPSALYEHAIRFKKDTSIAENGALVAYSGAKTGRSPKDKHIVRHPGRGEECLVGTREHFVR